MLKVGTRQLLTDSRCESMRTALDMMFQLPVFQKCISGFHVASYIDLREKKGEVAQAQQKLVKRVECMEVLEISWWRICADVSLFQFKECERKEEKIVAEE